MKPSVPLILTLDHPAGSWLISVTLVPEPMVVTTAESVDGALRKLTPPVVISVSVVLAATAVCARANARQEKMITKSILRI